MYVTYSLAAKISVSAGFVHVEPLNFRSSISPEDTQAVIYVTGTRLPLIVKTDDVG